MSQESQRLTEKSYWAKRSKGHGIGLAFELNSPNFRDLHALFQRHLPADDQLSFIEVGCHPGRFLWYFHTQFKYQVTGVEYVEVCCDETRDSLEAHDVPVTLINEDFFALNLAPEARFDVVGSFGFVEHFRDYDDPIKRHCDLVKPGGFAVISVPNHTGLAGWLMKRMSPDRYAAHNQMSYEELEQSVLKCDGMRYVGGGYLGRFGFWNTSFYYEIGKWPRIIGLPIKAVCRVLERCGRFIPNSRWFSPNAVIIARRDDA